MKFNFSGRKTPRSVSEITSTFTDVVNELSERIEHDDQEIAKSKQEIADLQAKIGNSQNSKNAAISIRSRIQELLGN